MNFLAGLFADQYQSLNAYCLAISSAHENVQGVSVGIHPAVAHFSKASLILDLRKQSMPHSGM